MRRTATALCLALTLCAGCPPAQQTTSPRRARRPTAPDRLKGDWYVVSTLKLRQGLGEPSKLLLAMSKQLQQVIDGNISLEGVPKVVSAMAGGLVSQYVKQLVPKWATQLVQRLAQLDEALNDLRVESIETLRAAGNNRYEGSSRWLQVTVRSGSLRVTASAKNIPGFGRLAVAPYAAEERAGALQIHPHAIHHRLGKLYRWVLEALLSGITCSTKVIPCFKKVEQLVAALVPCDQLAGLLAKASPALYTLKPLLELACQTSKKRLVEELGRRLDGLTLKLQFAQLQGQATITADETWTQGVWRGKLGKAYGAGTFGGTFHGRRAGTTTTTGSTSSSNTTSTTGN